MRRRFPSLLLTACLLASGGLAVTAVADNRDDLVTQQEQNDQLLEQLRANLLRAISHDLRTPLTSISGNADMLLRGAVSDLLTPETAAQMLQRGPRPRMLEFAGIGHAPTLVAADQVAAVTQFLLAPEATHNA